MNAGTKLGVVSRGWAMLLTLAVFATGAWGQSGDIDAVKKRLAAMKPADYPSKAIEFTVGGPPGGAMDVTTRLLARKFEEYTGQTAIVNNRVGAGGMIANRYLAMQAPADGYHLGVIANSIIGDTFLRSEGKWSYRDVDSLAFVNSEPVVWLASSEGQFKGQSLSEILGAAKRTPGSVRVGVVSGTLFEMLAEQVEAASGVSLIKVPYPGGTPALTALIGGHIDLTFGFVGEFEGMGDRVRPVATSSQARTARLPNVPTFDSVLGTNDVQWQFWRYVAAPKGMLPARRAWLVAALNAALRDTALTDEYRRRGASVNRDGLESPEAVLNEVERLAVAERAFYLRSGRLKAP